MTTPYLMALQASSTRPLLSYHPTGRRGQWYLEEPWSKWLDDETVLTVRSPFSFDLASVPRLLWVVPGYAPMELSVEASLAHDYIYRYRGILPARAVEPERTFTRREADSIFLLLMKEKGIANPRRRLAWLGVRLIGWLPWWKKGKPAT